MVLAIVGSVSLAGNAEAQKTIDDVLDQLKPDRVVSGGAVGIDTMGVDSARAREIPTTVHYPGKQEWLANSRKGFWARNILVANECTHLVRIVASDSKTYGSGWTRDQAKKLGKPTREIIIEVG